MAITGQIGREEALQKVKHYCAYQERSHKEVREKLFGFGLRSKEVNEIIATLIEETFLNEERFAKQYAGGKFRMKQWGRRKIEAALQAKGITKGLIKTAMKAIDEAEYNRILLKLAQKKWNSLAGNSVMERKAKTTFYLMQKGFEPGLIAKMIKEIAR